MMKSTQLPRFAHSTVHQDNEPCRNCGTLFCGNYCPGCGQEAMTGAPTTMGFIYEFLTRNILERGKLPKTLWQLIRYPGSLTVDFLEGRRQRSIRPVRLYFGLSVLYFLLLSLTSNFGNNFADNFSYGDKTNSGRTTSKAEADKPVQFDVNSKDLDFLDQVLPPDVAKELRKRLSRFTNMPEKDAAQTVINGMRQQISKAMFFLLPVFALILKSLFFTRRIPYGAHLLFAFHYHAMLFVCLLILLLPLPGIIEFIIFMWACLYLPFAIRRTYEIGWFSTLWRCFMLSMLYLIAISLALLAALAAAVLL